MPDSQGDLRSGFPHAVACGSCPMLRVERAKEESRGVDTTHRGDRGWPEPDHAGLLPSSARKEDFFLCM